MGDDASNVLESVSDLLCSLDREGTAEIVRAIAKEYDRMADEIERLRNLLADAQYEIASLEQIRCNRSGIAMPMNPVELAIKAELESKPEGGE